MPELGQTNDPTDLVPGNPDRLYAVAGALTQYGDLLGEAGQGLSKIATDWQGPAADAFRQAYHVLPQNWLNTSEAFRDAASAVDSYAEKLSWAQQNAAEAIDLYRSNPAAAQLVLKTARDDLSSAGSTYASALAKADSKMPANPGILDDLGHPFEALGSLIGGLFSHAVTNPWTWSSSEPPSWFQQQNADGTGSFEYPGEGQYVLDQGINEANGAPSAMSGLGYKPAVPPKNVMASINKVVASTNPLPGTTTQVLAKPGGGGSLGTYLVYTYTGGYANGWALFDSSGNLLTNSLNSDVNDYAGQELPFPPDDPEA